MSIFINHWDKNSLPQASLGQSKTSSRGLTIGPGELLLYAGAIGKLIAMCAHLHMAQFHHTCTVTESTPGRSEPSTPPSNGASPASLEGACYVETLPVMGQEFACLKSAGTKTQGSTIVAAIAATASRNARRAKRTVSGSMHSLPHRN